MRAKALAMALSRKLKEGGVVFVDAFGMDAPKTAAAKKALVALGGALGLKNLSTKTKNAAVVACADPREAVSKSFRNLSNVEFRAVRELNPVSILKNSYVILENPEASLAVLSHRVNGSSAGAAPKKPVSKPKTAATKTTKKSVAATRADEKGDQ
jgi:ribosomal protein L4